MDSTTNIKGLLGCIFVFAVSFVLPSHGREWRIGNDRVTGDFERLGDGEIHLRIGDDVKIVSMSELSDRDRGYVNSITRERTWTNQSGKQITAALVARTATSITIRKDSKEFTIQISNLSAIDQERLQKTIPWSDGSSADGVADKKLEEASAKQSGRRKSDATQPNTPIEGISGNSQQPPSSGGEPPLVTSASLSTGNSEQPPSSGGEPPLVTSAPAVSEQPPSSGAEPPLITSAPAVSGQPPSSGAEPPLVTSAPDASSGPTNSESPVASTPDSPSAPSAPPQSMPTMDESSIDVEDLELEDESPSYIRFRPRSAIRLFVLAGFLVISAVGAVLKKLNG